MVVDIDKRMAQLRSELLELEGQKRILDDVKRQQTPRLWKFTFTLDHKYFRDIRPGSQVTGAVLKGEVINRAECSEAGWSEDQLRGGHYGYLINLCNGKIIKPDGGGSVFINDGVRFGFGHSRQEIQEAMDDSDFIYKALENIIACWMENLDNAEPVDVSTLITEQRQFSWR